MIHRFHIVTVNNERAPFPVRSHRIGSESKTNNRAIANDWTRGAGHLGTEEPPECCLPDQRAGHASTGGFGEADHNQAPLCGDSVTNSKITEVPVRVSLRATESMHYETGMTPSSPEAMKMDSRVPGVDFARGAPGRPTLYVVV